MNGFYSAGGYIGLSLNTSSASKKEGPLKQIFQCLRPQYTPLVQSYICNPAQDCALILEKAGEGSGWRRLTTEGKSLAFSLDYQVAEESKAKVQQTTGLVSKALALWLFIVPGREDEVQLWQVTYFLFPV